MTTDLPTSVQDAMLRLARQLAKHNLDIDDLANESGLAFSSVEAGDDSFDLYDDDGNVKLSIGFDDNDGRFRIHHRNTTPPPKPESPDCTPVSAGVLVKYDGTFADDEPAPSDLFYFEVHASTDPDFVADDTTLIGSITSVDGGTFIHGVVDEFTTHYYAIVAVDFSGNESEQSDGTAGVSGGLLGYQDGHVVSRPTDPSDLRFHTTYQPVGDSTLHFYWNGVLQEDDAWDLTDPYTVTVNDTDGLAAIDDRFYVKYLYRDPGLRTPSPASLTVVGSTHVEHGAASIPLPAGTEAGDILVLSMITRTNTSPCDCADSRIVSGHARTNFAVAQASAWLGYGYEDGSGADLPITLPAGISSSSRAELVVFRVTGTIAESFVEFSTANPAVPAVPTADIGIIALVSESGVVASDFNNDSTGEWTTVAPSVDSTSTTWSGTLTAYTLTGGLPAGSWGGLGSGEWAALVLGLTED